MSRGQRVLLWVGAVLLFYFGAVNYQDALIAYGGLYRAEPTMVLLLVVAPIGGALALIFYVLRRAT